jgi:urocanate hydratase
MNGGVCLVVDIDKTRLEKRIQTRYLDEIANNLDDAVARCLKAKNAGTPLSVGLVGNAAEVFPKLLSMDVPIDIVTDQTSAHDPLSYIPIGVAYEDAAQLAADNPADFTKRSQEAMAKHVEAMVGFMDKGAEVFNSG